MVDDEKLPKVYRTKEKEKEGGEKKERYREETIGSERGGGNMHAYTRIAKWMDG